MTMQAQGGFPFHFSLRFTFYSHLNGALYPHYSDSYLQADLKLSSSAFLHNKSFNQCFKFILILKTLYVVSTKRRFHFNEPT